MTSTPSKSNPQIQLDLRKGNPAVKRVRFNVSDTVSHSTQPNEEHSAPKQALSLEIHPDPLTLKRKRTRMTPPKSSPDVDQSSSDSLGSRAARVKAVAARTLPHLANKRRPTEQTPDALSSAVAALKPLGYPRSSSSRSRTT